MKTDSLIFRKLTSTEFKAITNTINSEGGGSQTYIDFPKGKIPDQFLQKFFGNSGKTIKNGFEWNFYVESPTEDIQKQEATISARRDSSNSLREQNSDKRLTAWTPSVSDFPETGYDEAQSPIVLYILRSTENTYWAGWFYRKECLDTWYMSKGLSKMIWEDCGYIELDVPISFNTSNCHWPFGDNAIARQQGSKSDVKILCYNYIAALRTKPFLLLAGISGTGKSRIVREFAFKSCPEYLRDAEGTTPGNYLMVEVKPNWHDSTELLGYWSNLTGKYMFTNFVKFLVKAKMFPNVPFFVCLDEMNLAPVEQYFAEFLSVLETRKHTADGISTGVLVGKEWLRTLATLPNVKDGRGNPVAHLKTDRDIYMKLYGIYTEDKIEEEVGSKTTLIDTGLTLPENVFVVGTVNMDDTTHQFSRKVIDRAMTIEMNGGALTDIFKGKEDLTYTDTPLTMADFGAKYITAVEAVEHCQTLVENEDYRKYVMGEGESEDGGLPGRLAEINRVLAGTPFTVSYRVMNELTIHLAVLLDEAAKDGGGIDKEQFDSLVNTAIDHILLMKILPRIEGDDEMFRLSDKEQREAGVRSTGNHEATKLDWLRMVAPQRAEEPTQEAVEEQAEEDSEGAPATAAKEEKPESVYMAIDKIDEMTERLNRQNFTRFWP